MKPENIMLLGFINRAADYLQDHIDENPNIKLSETDNIDFSLLRKELNKNLNASLGNMKETAEKLLQAGYDAFDEFINSQKNVSLVDEIDKLFDVNFEGNDLNSEDDIAKLLDYYQLNDKLDNDNIDSDNELEIEKNNDNPESTFEMSDEDKELLRLISQNVSKTENPSVSRENVSTEKGIYSNNNHFDSIYSKIIDKNGQPDLIRFSNPGLNPDDVKLDDIHDQNDKALTDDQERFVELFNNYVDSSLNSVISNKPVEQPDKDDIIGLVKDMQQSDKQYYEHILQAEPEYTKQPEKQESEYNYAFPSDMLDDLKKKMIAEDERQAKQEAEFSSVYDKIHEIYPYLPREFVKNVYLMKNTITAEYPLDIKVIILHRIHFKDVESLRQFVEIALNHNYSINADENKLIVDAFKQHINADGKIITSILEVANQCALLEAEYEGYRVLFKEDE